jgi:hypothetical protein
VLEANIEFIASVKKDPSELSRVLFREKSKTASATVPAIPIVGLFVKAYTTNKTKITFVMGEAKRRTTEGGSGMDPLTKTVDNANRARTAISSGRFIVSISILRLIFK